ncbi:MAG: hypothetical protein OEL84_00805 [Nitrosopumilus sp.]|nr:hypothetical protein [Nitrosopumilus sp.]
MSEMDPILISLVVNIGVMLALIATLGFTAKAYIDGKNTRYVENLNGFQKEIMEMDKTLPSCNSNEQDFKQYAVNYVNILERIAKLNFDGKISDDMTEFFQTEFKIASALENWYVLNGDPNEETVFKPDYWKNFGKYCSKHKIEKNNKYAKTFWDNWDCYRKSLA